MGERIRVLCVDDSALMRKLLTTLLESQPDIEVVGTAPDPLVAREKIKKLDPDVLTLDVEMPRMDGLSFLEKVMRLRPMPVVMVSTLTEHGATATLTALQLGAVDFVTKPKTDLAHSFEEIAEELVRKVRVASRAKVRRLLAAVPSARASEAPRPPIATMDVVTATSTTSIVAIGASTGGTEAIREVLSTYPRGGPPVVLTQHLPATFAAPFAKRLAEQTPVRVQLAREGELLEPGCGYLPPGDVHLELKRAKGGYTLRFSDGPRVNLHKPSVDVLFHSVAKAAGKHAVGALLTGMGNDGAAGLLAMREAGAHTIAQDEASSVVWGMPGVAAEMNAAVEVLPLSKVTEGITRSLVKRRKAS